MEKIKVLFKNGDDVIFSAPDFSEDKDTCKAYLLDKDGNTVGVVRDYFYICQFDEE